MHAPRGTGRLTQGILRHVSFMGMMLQTLHFWLTLLKPICPRTQRAVQEAGSVLLSPPTFSHLTGQADLSPFFSSKFLVSMKNRCLPYRKQRMSQPSSGHFMVALTVSPEETRGGNRMPPHLIVSHRSHRLPTLSPEETQDEKAQGTGPR